MKKLALLAFGATIAATPAFAVLTSNALTTNSLTSNSLTVNSLTNNAVTSNALTRNAIATAARTYSTAKGSAMVVTGDAVRAISLP